MTKNKKQNRKQKKEKKKPYLKKKRGFVTKKRGVLNLNKHHVAYWIYTRSAVPGVLITLLIFPS